MNDDLRALAADTPGWLEDAQGEMLYAFAGWSPGPVVELGSYCGKSTVWLAAGAGDRMVVSVDWHRGSPEMAPGRECHDPDMLDEAGRHDTLRHLRRTMLDAGFPDVVLMCATTNQAAEVWGAPIGFLFIDACHDGQVADDVHRWMDLVMPGGFCALHDTNIPVVNNAAMKLLRGGWSPAAQVSDLRVFQRPRGEP